MANTTNLNLEEASGSSTLKTFPTLYNSNLGKIDAFAGKIKTFTLLASTVSTSGENKTVTSLQQFYKIGIALLISDSTQVQGYTEIPIDLLKNKSNGCVLNIYTNARKYAIVKYVDDTTLNMTVSDASFPCTVYGIGG